MAKPVVRFLGGYAMKREVFEPFPKVERIVEFSEEDIRENTCVTSVDY